MAAVKRTDKKTGKVSYVGGASLSKNQKQDVSSGKATLGYGYSSSSLPSSSSSSRLSYDDAETGLARDFKGSLGMAKKSLQDSYSLTTKINDPSQADSTDKPAGEDEYVPRYYQPETTITEPEPVEQIQRRMQKDAQKEINSLRDFERTLLNEQSVLNDKEDRSTQARNVMSGLSGSSEADFAQATTSAKGQKANERIRATVEVQVQGILSQIRKDAITEARAQRGDQAQDIQNAAARQELASKNLANLTASGVTFEGLRKTSPKEFEYLARQFGSTEALKGAFVLNTPQDQILDKQIKGGAYVIARMNPITGKVTVDTVDLGLPPEYTDTIDAGDRILAVPEGWDGDPSKLVSIPKGIPPKAGGGGGGPENPYANDLDAIIGATLSTIPTKFGQATFQAQIDKARNDADKINLIAAQVLRGQPAEFKTDFANQAVGISEVDKAIAELDSGVTTGYVQNGVQYAFNIVGKDYDPKLAKIAAHITAAIQPYRNSVTGAAWGQQEDAEYQQLFGSTKYEPTALRTRLVNLKDILKNKSATGLNTFVNPMGSYDNPFESGNLAPSGSRTLVSPSGETFDASDLTMDEYQAALADGYTPQ
jgi:hypothetical protein